MAYLTDQNIEKFVSKGQHFIMFYMPSCKTSQVSDNKPTENMFCFKLYQEQEIFKTFPVIIYIF